MVDLRFRDIVRFSCGCNMVADFELKKLVKPLQDWFDGHARVLPWRDDPKAYKVWISEIMLQQTRVEAVKPYFARFMEALPDVEALAACPEDRYLKLWEGLGYYNRVRNLHAAAEQIMGQYGGTIPDTVEELLRLKGIGSYTAGAIASIAYNRPVPAVDGNVLRVISRVCADDSDIMKQSVRSAMERSLQAMMEPECPWYGFCEARLQDKIDTIPVKTRAKARRIEERTVFVIRDGEHVALRKRPAKGLLAGLYELLNVSGILEQQEALEYVKNQGFSPIRIQALAPARHIFSHVEWHMHAYVVLVEETTAPKENILFTEAQKAVENYAVPSAFSAYWNAIKMEIKE